jgi:sigma-E factor negative regulatory protein RseA
LKSGTLVPAGLKTMKTTNRQDEHLSALVDGETERFETRRMVDALLDSSELRGRWARYHLIGEALRQEQPMLADASFSARVMERVREEDVEQIVPQGQGRGWVRPVLGLAMAASVAGAMVFGLQSMLGPEEGGMQQAPMEASVAPANQASDPGYHVPNQLESYMRMNGYLLSHAEQSGAQDVMPYARMVGYEPGSS